MKTISMTATLIVASALPAFADPTSAANDLVTILAAETSCELQIDQDALGAYFVDSGIDQADGLLAYIESAVTIRGMNAEPASASTCTMARARASSLGLLAN